MTRKRRWLWIVLFIFAVTILGTLATGFNVVLVRDYHRMLEMARDISPPSTQAKHSPWPVMVLVSLGFIAAIATWVLFFVKVLREMKLNQLQAEFLATVSHELKTPIASIELSSSLLRAGGLSPEESQQLWDAHKIELKRLRTEVETILEAARWAGNHNRILKAEADLEAWLSDSLARWKSNLNNPGQLQREGEKLPSSVKIDLKRLNLIADNLIDNAKKFSKEGTPDLLIRTSRIPSTHGRKQPRWRIEFHDRGWGFDPNESKKIFKRFFRSHHDAPYSIPGTGLGLYLANSASRAMGLKLKGESSGVGQGAVFTLEG